MTDPLDQLDLTDCDREPIHELGYVQDFGALLAINSDWEIVQHSQNASAIAGTDADLGAGTSLTEVLSPDAATAIRKAVAALGKADEVQRVFGIDLVGSGKLFDCAIHASGDLVLIEYEAHEAQSYASDMGGLRRMMLVVEEESTVEKICQAAAEQLKDLLGFDRVMVYQFRDDHSGEVIAEALEPGLETYTGLRYPKSDIPVQARALYLRNLFRIISDIDGQRIPIVPPLTPSGTPLDLSMSTLRAVSPVHLLYLRNMGVQASLSISIVVRGELWGLFACHHYERRVLPYASRSAAELFSQLFSMFLDRTITDEKARTTERGRVLHNDLMGELAEGKPLTEELPRIDALISEVIPHDGSSIYLDGRYTARGHAPDEQQFAALLPALEKLTSSQVVATDHIANEFPEAAPIAQVAAGALIIPTSRASRDYLILWRRELVQTVTWAGNPDKAVTAAADGGQLTPRSSFAEWKQSREGHSESWSEADLQIAESLRQTLVEVVLRLQDEASQFKDRAQQQQDLLIAELNHRVRNILNLIRSLLGQSRDEATDIGSFIDIVGGRIGALASAHDNITRKNWSPASIKELIDNEADAYLKVEDDRVRVTGEDMLIAPEAYTVLALVVHEMMTNSAKYGSLCDSSGKLQIALSRTADSDLSIGWQEIGGPSVRAPTRRGFGSTIIERSIPFELKGEAEISYPETGVEATFVIPARFLTDMTDEERDAADEKEIAMPSEIAAPSLPNHVLLVEDSMIIAMDAEDMFGSLGVKQVSTAASVQSAMAVIEESAPDFALLDFNLGSETSEAIADELRERSIPFYFATGYGDGEGILGEKGALGVLTKPYGKDDLARVLEIYGAG
ncbi:Light-sensor Protein kinase [Alteripontixanthobacter maritimus]|uniref:histidine kinase n=1 Tax=Alteripontixanthobacter maritimus TaxID=2161824 RepID=A0A369Q7E1_9SPHN|nr:HWE histidine kinase domain-containing protein [Alteripontixanthobacter maritimus]RDC60624.1 Light-sensor Protein kinase [Alteripontixanthobacter maritimus]